MHRQTQTSEIATPLSVDCSADCGVKVHIDYQDRMLWIDADKIRLSAAVCLDDLADAGYNIGSRTLGMVFGPPATYLDIPCSRQQAENILTHVGWDISQLNTSPA